MQRRTACFPETPPESQRADDRGAPATCSDESQRNSRRTLAANIYIYISSVPLYRTQVVVVLQRYRGGYQRVAAQGKCRLLEFFGGGSPQTSVETKQRQGWNSWVWLALSQLPRDCAPVALMAACVMEMGLELPELIPHVPSCVAPLWPASFSVQKPLLRQLMRLAPPQRKKNPKHRFGFQFECKVLGCVPSPQHKGAIGMLLLGFNLVILSKWLGLQPDILLS